MAQALPGYSVPDLSTTDMAEKKISSATTELKALLSLCSRDGWGELPNRGAKGEACSERQPAESSGPLFRAPGLRFRLAINMWVPARYQQLLYNESRRSAPELAICSADRIGPSRPENTETFTKAVTNGSRLQKLKI